MLPVVSMALIFGHLGLRLSGTSVIWDVGHLGQTFFYFQGMVKYDDISIMLLFLITNTMKKKPFLTDIFVYGSGPRGS